MHEVELGVWKALFTHLVRILYASAPTGVLVFEMDRRYRQISTFGRGSIRRFAENASEMKKMAARDFEDLLQCAIPVFEGLLPQPYDKSLTTLLYRFAEWHALAKLRMQSESSIEYLKLATRDLGQALRYFRDHVCPAFNTTELPREAESRARRAEKSGLRTSHARQAKTLNLDTYKFHSFGDYPFIIPWCGPLGLYSTQDVSARHGYYIPSSFSLEGRNQESHSSHSSHGSHHFQPSDSEPLPYTDINMHHHVSDSRESSHHLDAFVHRLGTDPAGTRFVPKLKGHLLSRLLGKDFDGDEEQYSRDELDSLQIVGNKIYAHQVLRVNFTTYDVRRDQDSVNPRTHSDVMVHSCETEAGAHPYWYARVLGIFHADVYQHGRNVRNRSVQRMEFLWVRWFVSTLACDLDLTFRFFRFVDRDMVMRYYGLGVGHTSPHSQHKDQDAPMVDPEPDELEAEEDGDPDEDLSELGLGVNTATVDEWDPESIEPDVEVEGDEELDVEQDDEEVDDWGEDEPDDEDDEDTYDIDDLYLNS
ncbi:uncharacterized protein C8Q71DRAFT_702877 [Rhodofomes roseus]|uniref:Uncharacterized protein n=1 Tax=Rhodofomes roseus TaxID=34475 RepID=A0ABQ8KP40_9APHY|nr:uncharacterized protein C8Q71DRAFT_702877 [Rhodofomes roseus]KAH9840199.1 hypothetical protein C8Q71DRAFT_702877 [Rhodofomes roseus]